MENVGSNKKGKIILCYFGLVVLIILLAIPPVFRLVFQEQKEEVKKDVVDILKCEKPEESVVSTFLNNIPQNIQYSILGNYALKEGEKKENFEEGKSAVLAKFIEFATIEYDESTNISSLAFNTEKAKGTIDYDVLLANVGLQAEYFQGQGFSCTKQTIEQ